MSDCQRCDLMRTKITDLIRYYSGSGELSSRAETFCDQEIVEILTELKNG